MPVEQQRPRLSSNLRKELVVTLLVKTLFLYLLWWLFFQEPSQEPQPANLQIEQALFGLSPLQHSDLNSNILQSKEPLHGN
ncbi:cytochrome oxidase putative small subunit CydP [Kaarinaea lacus]